MNKLLLLLLMPIAMLSASAQTVTVQHLQQSQMVENLAKLGKMTFADGKIQVYNAQGEQLTEIELSDETTIVIAENESVEIGEEVFDLGAGLDQLTGKVVVYPNPATDNLYVSGAEIGENIKIFSITGQQIMTVKVSSNTTTINVSTLPAGTYLMQLNNELLKLRKQ